MSKPNLGLLYNKEYFEYFEFDIEGNTKMKENQAMNDIFKVNKLKEYRKEDISLHKQMFRLTTVYPGLLCGAGYNHEVGKDKKKENPDKKNKEKVKSQDETFPEFQLGYYFDHTTGLPVIPASSIKGVLRYACEMRDGEYLLDILGRLEKNNKDLIRDFFIIDQNSEQHIFSICRNVISHFKSGKFVEEVFEGKNDGKGISIYERDIFLDAVPVKSKGKLFRNDYITNHDSPVEEPNPVQFLRVQPGVTYEFRFVLRDDKFITAELKKAIFKEIILDLGLGAKTNVGYGQFE